MANMISFGIINRLLYRGIYKEMALLLLAGPFDFWTVDRFLFPVYSLRYSTPIGNRKQ